MKSGSFDLRELVKPIIVAPMAGGPSTPALAAAGGNAGGLGFVPAGYLTAEVFAERLAEAKKLATGPIGANLFVSQPSTGDGDELRSYAEALAGEAERYGAALGEPRYDDDAWVAKVEVLHDLQPDAVSFTFGLPPAADVIGLRLYGIVTIATVTTPAEAKAAVSRGVDALVVQGPAAGGHRGTFDPSATPAPEPLDQLLAAVLAEADIPVIAAGGLMTAQDVAAVRSAGAVAAQLGTAFLLADEAGSSPVHRAALQDPAFTETVVTRAFSGRYARGLRNRFVDEHESQAPLAYPEVHHVTSPVRAASVRAGDPQATNIWAGTGFKQARTGPVAEIFDGLVGEG